MSESNSSSKEHQLIQFNPLAWIWKSAWACPGIPFQANINLGNEMVLMVGKVQHGIFEMKTWRYSDQ